MGDRFEVVADIAVGAMLVVRDVQPITSAAKGFVEVLPQEDADMAGDCFGAKGSGKWGVKLVRDWIPALTQSMVRLVLRREMGHSVRRMPW